MIDPKMPLVNAFWSGVHLGLGFNVIFDADGYFSSSILTIFLTAVVAIIYLLDEYCGRVLYLASQLLPSLLTETLTGLSAPINAGRYLFPVDLLATLRALHSDFIREHFHLSTAVWAFMD
jgi:hypothetical protein